LRKPRLYQSCNDIEEEEKEEEEEEEEEEKKRCCVTFINFTFERDKFPI
jgi:hypothetical protein